MQNESGVSVSITIEISELPDLVQEAVVDTEHIHQRQLLHLATEIIKWLLSRNSNRLHVVHANRDQLDLQDHQETMDWMVWMESLELMDHQEEMVFCFHHSDKLQNHVSSVHQVQQAPLVFQDKKGQPDLVEVRDFRDKMERRENKECRVHKVQPEDQVDQDPRDPREKTEELSWSPVQRDLQVHLVQLVLLENEEQEDWMDYRDHKVLQDNKEILDFQDLMERKEHEEKEDQQDHKDSKDHANIVLFQDFLQDIKPIFNFCLYIECIVPKCVLFQILFPWYMIKLF